MVSVSQLCRWFSVPRSSLYYRPRPRRATSFDPDVVTAVRQVIGTHPTYGVPRITACIRKSLSRPVNHKKVRRIVRAHDWQVKQRPKGWRPRVPRWRSVAAHPNTRWAIDITHFFCGRDGWSHLVAIIDCCDRTLVGWRLSSSGKANIAVAALEEALSVRDIQMGHDLTIRSDNGLVFGSKAFTKLVNAYVSSTIARESALLWKSILPCRDNGWLGY